MDAVRRLELNRARGPAPGGRRRAVRAAERAAERLVRGVAGLERDLEHTHLGLEQPERRPLEQDPALEPRRSLASARDDYAIELRPGQVEPHCEFAGASGSVQAGGYRLDERAEVVWRRAHSRRILADAGPQYLIVFLVFPVDPS
jgi:hypothetical protein